MTKVPVRPMRRLSLYFEIRDRLETMPLTQHISRNVSFRPQGAGYISGNTRCDELPRFSWEVDPPFRRGDLAQARQAQQRVGNDGLPYPTG
jgi:hypothetical protein